MRRKKGISAAHMVAGVFGIAVIAAVGFAAVMFGASKAPIDSKTLCAVSGVGPHTALNAILIDRSEPFNGLQQKDIVQTLRQMAASSDVGDEFDIFEMGVQDKLALEPTLVICNPGGEKSGSFQEKLETTPISKRVFEERFVDRLKKGVETEIDQGPLANSPIMEMIQGIQVGTLKASPRDTKRLIIVSDMMQHSKHFSQYREDGNDWSKFSHSSAFATLAVDMSGVAVRVLYVPRTVGQSQQRPGHKEFWTDYFNALGAKQIRFDLIEGGAWQPK